MKLSQSERETLIGPAAVGVFVGILFAVCTVAFDSEYKALPETDLWGISGPMLSFLGGFLLAFVPLGMAPVLIGRIKSGAGNKYR
ncbi:hypothetical protein [Massilia sp. 9I]|uniref:hypothetical protein n=1 Tax=Massilia sp. 9I TaxID=2653152 RepID=UPI0012F314F7|nr:hypothetical protein [Massilia sp. 9I]VXC15367.1 conserved hypothetical protein [Massilia sp. 9I]